MKTKMSRNDNMAKLYLKIKKKTFPAIFYVKP